MGTDESRVFEVIATPAFGKALGKIDARFREVIIDKIDLMAKEGPYSDTNTRPVRNTKHAGLIRKRIGDYRLFFTSDTKNRKITLVDVCRKDKDIYD